jgi:hypothetical protein
MLADPHEGGLATCKFHVFVCAEQTAEPKMIAGSNNQKTELRVDIIEFSFIAIELIMYEDLETNEKEWRGARHKSVAFPIRQ